ncbi:MAG TPA: sialidase family protein [Candidatus Thermoplasmatota archaeon]|nr:sialidase family protein [Candidatus Thermoplasmatota archaeon]
MRPLLALLALALAAAGCVAPESPSATSSPTDGLVAGLPTAGVAHALADRTLTPEELAAAPAMAGLQLSIGLDGVEPTIGIDADGTIFAEVFVEGQPTVVRSDDRGVTWTDVGPRLPNGMHNPPVTFDPYLYLDPATGRVFHNSNDLACAIISWSDDKGASWTTTPVGCGLGVGVADHQSMVAAKPRLVPAALMTVYPNVVYSCTNTGATTECATSLNGGATFGPVVTVFPETGNPDDCAGSILGHPMNDAEGRVYLAHGGCNNWPTVGVTEDDGLTWKSHVISRDIPLIEALVVHDVSLAVDENGTLYAGWIGDKGLPAYSFSRDHGVTWAPARVVSPAPVTATAFPAIAAGADGRLVFAYVGTTIEGGYEGRTTGGDGTITDLSPITGGQGPTGWENATWNAYLTVLADADSEDPVAVTVTANDPADPIARGVCGKTRCGGMTDFIDAEIDPSGRPYAIFVDVCTGKCADDPTAGKEGAVAFLGTLAVGPALRGDLGMLEPLAAPPTSE